MTWIYFFSDGAKELKKAATDLGSTVHLSSTPYRPESSGIIERRVGVISDGIRCLLGQSGFPHGWWTYAARAFCHGFNIRRNSNGMSPLAPALWSDMARQGQLCLRTAGALQEAAPLQDGREVRPSRISRGFRRLVLAFWRHVQGRHAHRRPGRVGYRSAGLQAPRVHPVPLLRISFWS